jgi:transposase
MCTSEHAPHPIMQPLSKAQTTHILDLLYSGVSAAQIHKDTGVGLATISRIRAAHCPALTKSSGGRPSKLSAADINYTKLKMRMGKISTAVQAAGLLQNITNTPITPQTMCNALKKTGWKAVVKQKRPALTKKHMKARLEFAQRHLEWTVEDWKKVWWSDETKINRFGSDGREYVWKEQGEGLNKRTVKETTKYGGGNVMVWGCMGWKGIGYATRIVDTMDANLYVRILDDELMKSLKHYKIKPHQIEFQQDNDSKHTSRKAKEWFEDHGIEVMLWPAHSPDLNPIEHLWVHVKNELKKYEEPASGVFELWERVESVWEAIPASVCQNLIESMPRRVQAVYKAKGAWTKY